MSDPAPRGAAALPRTHLAIDRRLCGAPVSLAPGAATVALQTLPEMAADDSGLVHGGFIFGLADHAAMLAVNEPTVVLAAAEVRFLKPVVVGETLLAEARREGPEGRKSRVGVVVRRGAEEVMVGDLTCFTPERHVLAARGGRAGGAGGSA
jgi:acyl-coenzyme A thioesterase PaaI-like protein